MPEPYYILDRPGDFGALSRVANLADGTLIVISAVAWSEIPDDWPTERLLTLDKVISQAEILAYIARERPVILAAAFADPCCPYYKAKQIIDISLEKRAIVDALERLPGIKHFVAQGIATVTPDTDLSESLGIAAFFMAGRPGFKALATSDMARLKPALRAAARNAVRAWSALRASRASATGPILVDTGYASEKDFAGIAARRGNVPDVIAGCIRRGRLARAWALICHDVPIELPRNVAPEQLMPQTALTLILKRSAQVHAIFEKFGASAGWCAASYLFSVKHGNIGDYAAVRAARKLGVPVVTMQHAAVGHDEWLASQYVDAMASDLKLVSSAFVAEELPKFENGQCAYAPSSIPHFRARTGEAKPWTGNELTYVLTGFTRVNTMYDQRRLNDVSYLAAVCRNLEALTPHFTLGLKPHPYNANHFALSIEHKLCRKFGIGLENAGLEACAGAVVIDSPTTILGDAVRLGKSVFVINETAVLREPFASRAKELHVLFDSASALAAYLVAADRTAIAAEQRAFRTFFLDTYMPPLSGTVPAAIDAWLAERPGSATGRSPASAESKRLSSAHH